MAGTSTLGQSRAEMEIKSDSEIGQMDEQSLKA